MSRTDVYQSPLTERYASVKMKRIFSPDRKFGTWRRLWIALAKAEQALDVKVGNGTITDEQIAELKAHVDDINYEVANAREKEVRHDVMAHVYAYGQQCPKAAGVIHLGATSCFVTDNTDLLNLYDALVLTEQRVLGVIKILSDFADEHKAEPTLGYTHGQPAAVVTVGKRATLWIQEFEMAYERLVFERTHLKMLGCRGATGTADTFMELLDGDVEKVEKLEQLILKEIGCFAGVFPVSGQTYPRILDVSVASALAMVASAAYKMAEDIRLLQSFKEMEEPFGKNQIGSSAMAYKRNPMRSERIDSLARYVMMQPMNTMMTASAQWLERSLDDSANRRLSLPEMFLALDGVLILCANVTDGLVVYNAIIQRHLQQELPFMVTEKVIMRAVEKGMDRQEVHEKIRQHTMDATVQVKQFGNDNDLVQRIAQDETIPVSEEEIQKMMDPYGLTGCCAEQVKDYLECLRSGCLLELTHEIDKKVEV